MRNNDWPEGADCGNCPLHAKREGKPVPSELRGNARLALVSECPNKTEMEFARPLMGAAGKEESAALAAVGMDRRDVAVINAVMCRPPKGKMDLVLQQVRAKNKNIRARNRLIKRDNRERARAGRPLVALEPLVPTPVEACRGRFLREIAPYANVIALGKMACQALDPTWKRGILRARGMPFRVIWRDDIERNTSRLERAPDGDPDQWPAEMQALDRITVMPTVHPNFVKHRGRYRHVFHNDHRKALRAFAGETCPDPAWLLCPSVEDTAAFLGVRRAPAPTITPEGEPWPQDGLGRPLGWSGGWWADPDLARPLVIDSETTALEVFDLVDYCWQVGDDREAIVTYFTSPEQRSYYTAAELTELRHIYAAYLSGPYHLKMSHNGNYFDSGVSAARMGVHITYHCDGICPHRNLGHGLPNGLGFLGSYYTPIHDWKEGDNLSEMVSDEKRGLYGVRDLLVPALALPQILAESEQRGLGGLVPFEQSALVLPEPGRQYGIDAPERPCAVAGRVAGASWRWRSKKMATSDYAIDIPYIEVTRDSGERVTYPAGLANPKSAEDGEALREAGGLELHRGLNGVMALDHFAQGVLCRGLHDVGMLVDQRKRLEYLREERFGKFDAEGKLVAPGYDHLLTSLRRSAHEAAGTAKWGGTTRKPLEFNPASVYHLRRLLYETWRLPQLVFSEKTQSPSTGDKAIRQWLSRTLPDHVRHFLRNLRAWRKRHKVIGTYLIPMGLRHPEDKKARPNAGWGQSYRLWGESEQEERDHDFDWDALNVDLAEAFEAKELAQAIQRGIYAPPRRGKLHLNGRLHADYKAHVAATARLSSSPNCFSGDTEILTPDGWQRLDAWVEAPTRVMQWLPDGTLEWVEPIQAIRQEAVEDLCHIRTRAIDLLVTPDHRCPVLTRAGELEVRTAETFVGDRKQLHAGTFAGGGEHVDPMFVRWICAAQADGMLRRRGYGWRLDIVVLKPRKQRRLRAMAAWARAQGADVVCADRPARGAWGVWLKGALVDQIADLLAPIGSTPADCAVAKHFGPWLLRWDAAALDSFNREVFFWDGCWTRRNHYSSSVEPNADWVQTTLSLRGHRARKRRYAAASGRPNWQIDVTWERNYTWTTNFARTQVPSADGFVYCLQVPSSFVIVRRGANVMISGQTQNVIRRLRAMFVFGDLAWQKQERARLMRCLRQGELNEIRTWLAWGQDIRHWRPKEDLVGVYADSDQIELKVAASMWRLERYLDGFARGLDVHQITMDCIWEGKQWDLPGAPARADRYTKNYEDGSKFDVFRDLGKRFLYATIFAATVPTIFDVVSSAEKDGKLAFPQLTMEMAERMHGRLLKNMPQLQQGWANEVSTLASAGRLATGVAGHQFTCLDSFDSSGNILGGKELDLSLIVNRRIQSQNAEIIMLSTAEMVRAYPPGFAGPYTGHYNHCHDAQTLAVPRSLAEKVRRDLEDSMKRRVAALPDVVFSGKAKIVETYC